MWTLTLTALFSVSGLSAQTPPREPAPTWHISMRAIAPLTITDPQHVGFGLGLDRTGTFRAAVHYQPTEQGRFGRLYASLGLRILRRDAWEAALDMEHTQARPRRRLFGGSGWQLDGHDRQQLSLVTASVRWRERRLLGLIAGAEAGGGRLHVWRLVSARAGGAALGPSQDPILESSAPVGMVGLFAARSLPWGLTGHLRARLIGAGRTRGGEIPVTYVTGEWDISRQVFRSRKFGRGMIGVSGNHATSIRAASYFQNGAGLTFRIAF